MTTTKEQVRDSGSGTRRAGPDRPTLCFFYSPTSGPSRRVEAFLAQVLQRRQNHRTFELQRVNCDKHPELVERYAVTQMPTLIVIEGRHVLGRLEGSCGCREIEKLLEPWLNRGARARASRERNGTSPHTGAVVSSKASESPGESLIHPGRDGSAQTPYTPVGLRPSGEPLVRALGRRGQDIETVLRASGSILDALNPVRNNASVAHPNEDLLGREEAELVINVGRSLLSYLDAKLGT